MTYIISDIDKALAFEWVAAALPESDYQQSYLLLNPGDSVLEQFLIQHNIPVQRIHCAGKKDWLQAIWQVIRYLKKHKPDIVHCHLLQANIVGLTAARICGIKKRIYTRHHSDYHHRYYPKGVWIDRFCNAMASHIIAPSEVVKEVLLEREQVPPAKVTVIAHGFDLDYFTNVTPDRVKAIRDKYIETDRFPVIGVISRFTELKGIQYIIPAFERILALYPNALLMLFNAKGDYATQIMSMLAGLNPDNFRIVPFEYDLAAVYQVFDVFIQASTERSIEAFGQTYVEALAAGVPSIFTLSGVAGEFVANEKNAMVVPFENTDAIYETTIRLLGDKSLRERLSISGKEAVLKNFSLSRMIRRIEKLYNS